MWQCRGPLPMGWFAMGQCAESKSCDVIWVARLHWLEFTEKTKHGMANDKASLTKKYTLWQLPEIRFNSNRRMKSYADKLITDKPTCFSLNDFVLENLRKNANYFNVFVVFVDFISTSHSKQKSAVVSTHWAFATWYLLRAFFQDYHQIVVSSTWNQVTSNCLWQQKTWLDWNGNEWEFF